MRLTAFTAVVAVVCVSMSVSSVAAQRRGSATDEEVAAPAPTPRNINQIATRLDSTNPDEVREAIDLLSVIDHRNVIPPLAALLRSGRDDAITNHALQALRGLAEPGSVEVLSEFTHHRRGGARRRAYQALAAIDDPRVRTLLEQGLRDSDRSIRANCARSLGSIGASLSLDTLFLAFDRGVVEAGAAIGKVGDARSISRFNEHLGNAPLSVMLSGYREYLRRRDIPDEAKIEIIGRLGEVSGPMVRSFLQRYLDTFPTRGRASRSPVRRVVVDTLRRIPGAANAARGRVVPSGQGGSQ